MKKLFTLALLAISTIVYGQIPKTIFYEDSGQAYKQKDFSVSTLPISQLAGSYHFGESEGEWDLIVIPYKGGIIIQIMEGYWGNDKRTGKLAWLTKYTTFNDVKVTGKKFQFGKYSGLFATYTGKIEKAVLLFGSPTEDKLYGADTAEAGHYGMNLKTYFHNKTYSELSTQVISGSYLAGKTKEQLKYMRNEVFAYYGLIFQTPAVSAQFAKKDWYKPWRKNVEECLTAIEKQNLALIKQYETK